MEEHRKKEFERLVDAYGSQVLNAALRISGCRDLARDIYQEVFLSIWRIWETFDDTTLWRAYLYRATIRKAIETVRKNGREPTMELIADPAAPWQQPEDAALSKELYCKLAECLARLSRRQADIFVLSRIEGLSCGEIAEVMSCAEATVRVHLFRATRAMAQKLTRYVHQRKGTA